jgi:hypothetical protein
VRPVLGKTNKKQSSLLRRLRWEDFKFIGKIVRHPTPTQKRTQNLLLSFFEAL